MDKTVVILAAGRGSRAGGLTEDTSKCVIDLDRTNPIVHTLRSFEDAGVNNAIVVTGYHEAKVRCEVNKLLHRFGSKMNVTFVYNKDYDFHGCEYSLSCASEEMKKYDTVIITEGDLIMDPSYIKRIVEDKSESGALFRHPDFIIDTKSVVGVRDVKNPDNPDVHNYVYDSTHKSVLDFIYDKSTIIGDSMQVWKFSGKSLGMLVNYLSAYRKEADMIKLTEGRPYTHNGLHNINKTIKRNPFKAIMVPKSDSEKWFNLNTKEDIEKAKTLKWLNRHER